MEEFRCEGRSSLITMSTDERHDETSRSGGVESTASELDLTSVPATEAFEFIQQVVTAARNIRADLKLDPKRKVSAECFIPNPVLRKVIEDNIEPIQRLATLSEIRFVPAKPDPTAGVMRSSALFALRISYGEGIDRQAEISRLRKEIDKLEKDIRSKEDRLADEDFRKKAPEHVVSKLDMTKVERQIEQKNLKEQLALLERNP